MKKSIITILLVMLAAVASLSATVITPDVTNNSFILMAEEKYEKDYIVDKTTWSVLKFGYLIEQMDSNIWALTSGDTVTVVAINADKDDLEYLLRYTYRYVSVNVILYNTKLSSDIFKYQNGIKAVYASDLDSRTKAYLGQQKDISFRTIKNDTSVTLINGTISLSPAGNDYILVRCPDCGAGIYVSISDYI